MKSTDYVTKSAAAKVPSARKDFTSRIGTSAPATSGSQGALTGPSSTLIGSSSTLIGSSSVLAGSSSAFTASSASLPGSSLPTASSFASGKGAYKRDSLRYASYHRSVATRGFETGEPPLVIDLGSRYIKVGFANEPAPRKIYFTKFITGNRRLSSPHAYQDFEEGKRIGPEDLFLTSTPLSEGTWDQILELVINELIFTHLQVKPSPTSPHRKVYICEDPFWPSFFRWSIARKLFETGQKFHVCYADALALPLFTTGGDTGLVMDIGYSCTNIQAVVGGHVLIESRKQHPVGMRSVLCRFKKKMWDVTSEQLNFTKLDIKDEDVEAAICRICFVQVPENEARKKPNMVAYEFRTNQGTAYVHIPGEVRGDACESLFGTNEYGANLGMIIAEALLEVPLDCRPILASNILICGGTANLPGIHYRILKELKHAMANLPECEPLKKLTHRIRFLEVKNFKLNTLVWLGGAIYGALKIPEEDFWTKKKFDDREREESLASRPKQTEKKEKVKRKYMSKDSDMKEVAPPLPHTFPPTVGRSRKPSFPSIPDKYPKLDAIGAFKKAAGGLTKTE